MTVPPAEDLDAIRRDDVLLDALAARRGVGAEVGDVAGDPAAGLLAALVEDVWSEPMLDAPEPGPPHGRRLRRLPRTVVALSVTTVVLATTGVAAAAADFTPFSFDGGGSSIGEDRTHPHFPKGGPGLSAEHRDQPGIPAASGPDQDPTASVTPTPSASSQRPVRHDGGGSRQGQSPDPSSPSSPVVPSSPSRFGNHNGTSNGPQSSPSAQPSVGQGGPKTENSPDVQPSSSQRHAPSSGATASSGTTGDLHLNLLRLARYGHTFRLP